jgi:hypothetical protein
MGTSFVIGVATVFSIPAMRIDQDKLLLTEKKFRTTRLSAMREKSRENSSRALGLMLLPV